MKDQPWARFQGLTTCLLRSVPGQPNVTVHVEWAAQGEGDDHELAFEVKCTMQGIGEGDIDLFDLEVPRVKAGGGRVMAEGTLDERMPPDVMAAVLGIVSDELRSVAVALQGMGNVQVRTGAPN